MVMTVCLLVYAALEHRIRRTLAEHDESVPDQKGKPTQRPTTRWVFELFMDVHLLTISTKTAGSVNTLVEHAGIQPQEGAQEATRADGTNLPGAIFVKPFKRGAESRVNTSFPLLGTAQRPTASDRLG
jgi:hypothetical protein